VKEQGCLGNPRFADELPVRRLTTSSGHANGAPNPRAFMK